MATPEAVRHYVYQHTFADGSIYIGKGVGNRAYIMSPSKRNALWMRAAEKYGKPKVSFIKTGIDEELALFIEAEAVDVFKERGRKLRNLAPGGHAPHAGMTGELSPSFGRKHTKEWRERASAANSGKGNPHYGMTHGQKAKDAISASTKKCWSNNRERMCLINKGRKYSPERRAKIGQVSRMMSPESRELIRIKNTGKKRTPEQIENYKKAANKRALTPVPQETRQKMSKNQWRKDRTIHEFVGPEGQVFSGTRSEFAKEFGFSINDLFRVDKKRRPHVKGWRLADGDS